MIPNRLLGRRLRIIFTGALSAAIATGMFAPNPTILVLGLLAIGAGTIVALLYYLPAGFRASDPEPTHDDDWPGHHWDQPIPLPKRSTKRQWPTLLPKSDTGADVIDIRTTKSRGRDSPPNPIRTPSE